MTREKRLAVSRRGFVVGGVATVGALGAVSVYAINVSSQDAVASLLRTSFPKVDFNPAELSDFAGAAVKRHGPFSRGQILAMEHSIVRKATDTLTDRDVRTLPTQIVTDFIRSSDVLDPERDGPCSYFAYADPYALGCSNPLPTYADAPLEWPETVYS